MKKAIIAILVLSILIGSLSVIVAFAKSADDVAGTEAGIPAETPEEPDETEEPRETVPAVPISEELTGILQIITDFANNDLDFSLLQVPALFVFSNQSGVPLPKDLPAVAEIMDQMKEHFFGFIGEEITPEVFEKANEDHRYTGITGGLILTGSDFGTLKIRMAEDFVIFTLNDDDPVYCKTTSPILDFANTLFTISYKASCNLYQ